jgi:hypothetical protein
MSLIGLALGIAPVDGNSVFQSDNAVALQAEIGSQPTPNTVITVDGLLVRQSGGRGTPASKPWSSTGGA